MLPPVQITFAGEMDHFKVRTLVNELSFTISSMQLCGPSLTLVRSATSQSRVSCVHRDCSRRTYDCCSIPISLSSISTVLDVFRLVLRLPTNPRCLSADHSIPLRLTFLLCLNHSLYLARLPSWLGASCAQLVALCERYLPYD